VRDKAGKLVFGLKANDFILTDDGIPQKLALQEDTDSEPLALVVLIEAGAATQIAGWHPISRTASKNRFRALPIMVEAIAANVPHKIAVVGFDSQPELLHNFTSNLDDITSAIDDFSEEDTGDHGAAILDGVGFAVDLLLKQPPQYRRAILLLSETNDRGSKLPLADALHAITSTNTAIYSVAFSTGYAEASRYGAKHLPTKRAPPTDANQPYTPFGDTSAPSSIASAILRGLTTGITFENPDPNPPGGCMGKDPGADVPASKPSQAYDCSAQLLPPLALARMAAIAATDGLRRNIPETVAKLTGGEYFKFNDARSLERDLATISNHVPNRYVLSFQPVSPHPGPHALSLQVKDYVRLDVTARNSYWADPESIPTTQTPNQLPSTHGISPDPSHGR
jgi:VWFA-related protein